LKKILFITILASILGIVNKFLFHSDITFIRYDIEEYAPDLSDGTADKCPYPLEMLAPKEIDLEVARCFHLKGATFIDARDEDIFIEGHIPGAINIPFNDFDPNYIDDYYINPDSLYVIYCDGGDCTLGADLAESLFDFDFNRILLYEGGYPEWEESIYPVVKN